MKVNYGDYANSGGVHRSSVRDMVRKFEEPSQSESSTAITNTVKQSSSATLPRDIVSLSNRSSSSSSSSLTYARQLLAAGAAYATHLLGSTTSFLSSSSSSQSSSSSSSSYVDSTMSSIFNKLLISNGENNYNADKLSDSGWAEYNKYDYTKAAKLFNLAWVICSKGYRRETEFYNNMRTAQASTVNMQGLGLLRQGRLDEAIGEFDHAIKHWPHHPDVARIMANKAHVLNMLGRHKEAHESATKALSSNASNQGSYAHATAQKTAAESYILHKAHKAVVAEHKPDKLVIGGTNVNLDETNPNVKVSGKYPLNYFYPAKAQKDLDNIKLLVKNGGIKFTQDSTRLAEEIVRLEGNSQNVHDQQLERAENIYIERLRQAYKGQPLNMDTAKFFLQEMSEYKGDRTTLKKAEDVIKERVIRSSSNTCRDVLQLCELVYNDVGNYHSGLTKAQALETFVNTLSDAYYPNGAMVCIKGAKSSIIRAIDLIGRKVSLQLIEEDDIGQKLLANDDSLDKVVYDVVECSRFTREDAATWNARDDDSVDEWNAAVRRIFGATVLSVIKSIASLVGDVEGQLKPKSLSIFFQRIDAIENLMVKNLNMKMETVQ